MKSALIHRVLLGFSAALWFGCIGAHAASFDCKKAKSETERAICDNAELSKRDEELAKAYRVALSKITKTGDKRILQQEQREWPAMRDARCYKDHACLIVEYDDRINFFKKTISEVNGVQNSAKSKDDATKLSDISREDISTIKVNKSKREIAAASKGSKFFRLGEFVRYTRSQAFPLGGRETGSLRILDATHRQLWFRLELSMNPQAGDDGFLTRSGVVESETAEVYGASAIYGSTEDKTLGACKLTFRPDGQSVLVAQSGNCPGLGEGVNASGKYRLAKKDEVLVVR